MSILEVIRRHEALAAAGEQQAAHYLLRGNRTDALEFASQAATHRHYAYEYSDVLSQCAQTVLAAR